MIILMPVGMYCRKGSGQNRETMPSIPRVTTRHGQEDQAVAQGQDPPGKDPTDAKDSTGDRHIETGTYADPDPRSCLDDRHHLQLLPRSHMFHNDGNNDSTDDCGVGGRNPSFACRFFLKEGKK